MLIIPRPVNLHKELDCAASYCFILDTALPFAHLGAKRSNPLCSLTGNAHSIDLSDLRRGQHSGWTARIPLSLNPAPDFLFLALLSNYF